ncbi:MAG: hypothetical protein IJX99_07540 [Clostridia bacterium]|nr:hypothetical protein [Clostridia bacterium]
MGKRKSWIKKLVDKILGRDSKVKMLTSDIDTDIEELVMMLNDNYMMPFASCDGNLKHHFDKWGNYDMDTTYAYVAMLESDKARDLFALLQDDDSYELTITSNKDMELYGNQLKGLRYGIYFDNHRGKKAQELTEIVKDYLLGDITPSKEQRKRMDQIADTVQRAQEKNLMLDFSIHEIFRLENEESPTNNFSVRLFEIEPQKDLSRLALREINDEDQSLEIGENGFYYRTGDFSKSVQVAAGLIDAYELLPEKPSRDEIMEDDYGEIPARPDEVSVHIQKLTNNMYEYRDELKQRQVDKSIARHKRKMAKRDRKDDEIGH